MNNYLDYINVSDDRLKEIFNKQDKKNEFEPTKNKIHKTKETLEKILTKFYNSILTKYPNAEAHELIEYALKEADKQGLTSMEEKQLLVDLIKKNKKINSNPYFNTNTIFTDFFNIKKEYLLNVSDDDKHLIETFNNLYTSSHSLYAKSRDMSHTYPSNRIIPTITGAQFTINFNDPQYYIHPILFCLYAIKIDYIDNISLWSNIGRLIINNIPHLSKKFINKVNSSPYEDKQDELLRSNISRDPAGDIYFSEEKLNPLENLLKRYQIQILIWKNVLKLREGQLYINNLELINNAEMSSIKIFKGQNYIQSLIDELNNFDLTYFDNPEPFIMRNEGTFLKKFLAVFSIRSSVFSYSNMPFIPNNLNVNINPQMIKSNYFYLPVCVLPYVNKDSGKGRYTVEELIESKQYLYLNKQLTTIERKFEYGGDMFFVIINRDAEINNFNFVGFDPKKDVQYNKPVLNDVPIQVNNLYFKKPNITYYLHAFTYVNNDLVAIGVCHKTIFEPVQTYNISKPAIKIENNMQIYQTLLNTRATVLIYTTKPNNILI